MQCSCGKPSAAAFLRLISVHVQVHALLKQQLVASVVEADGTPVDATGMLLALKVQKCFSIQA